MAERTETPPSGFVQPPSPFWLALCERFGLDSHQVVAGSMRIESDWSGDKKDHVCVAWEGFVTVPLSDINDLLGEHGERLVAETYVEHGRVVSVPGRVQP